MSHVARIPLRPMTGLATDKGSTTARTRAGYFRIHPVAALDIRYAERGVRNAPLATIVVITPGLYAVTVYPVAVRRTSIGSGGTSRSGSARLDRTFA